MPSEIDATARGRVETELLRRGDDGLLEHLLDFADGRHVRTVRLVARARSPQATLTVLMKK